SLVETELHAHMGGRETQLLVEAVRIGAPLVRGELDALAAARAGDVERRGHDLSPDAGAAQRALHPNRLHQHLVRAELAQAGDEGELHGADDLAIALGHQEAAVASRRAPISALALPPRH